MAKKVAGYIKLQVKAGQANPSPPIGPALGQRGLNIMMFCKDFNAQTKDLELGAPVSVVITYFVDKSFAIAFKGHPATYHLKKAAGIKSGSATTGRGVAGSVTMDQVREIAQIKMQHLNAQDIDQAAKIIAGSARSMGLTVKE